MNGRVQQNKVLRQAKEQPRNRLAATSPSMARLFRRDVRCQSRTRLLAVFRFSRTAPPAQAVAGMRLGLCHRARARNFVGLLGVLFRCLTAESRAQELQGRLAIVSPPVAGPSRNRRSSPSVGVRATLQTPQKSPCSPGTEQSWL